MRKEWKRLLGGLVGGAMVLDLLVNGLLGGSFDESMSSRAGRMMRQGSVLARGVCAVLALLETEHCGKAADDQGGG